MQISTRDLEVVAFVARFGQVTHNHVRRTVFRDNRSQSQVGVTLRRLVDQKLLARIEIKKLSGANGGARPYVYQIGSAGWKLAKTDGAYWQARSVNYHSLAIADTYVKIYESQGLDFSITRLETEPDSHVKIAYVPLLPDLYVELQLKSELGLLQRKAWLEVDLGTERPKQLKDKLQRYHDAWNGAGDHWDPFPLVVWVVPDDKRKRELESLIALSPRDSQAMYRVTLLDDVVRVVTQ